MPRLDEAVLEILDRVRAELSSAPELAEVRAVVGGTRARPMPELPAIWVVPEPATQDAETYGAEETWTLPLGLAALVRSDDPEQGARDAARLAALARRVALRALPMPWVTWVRSSRADLEARSTEANRTLYWADVTVEVRFSLEE
ncbi:MAG TPA: hypothetical protein VNO79_01410 [Actinomycetota bacterium]|nr:hypothetical protein [Actinomycetota bacterium]